MSTAFDESAPLKDPRVQSNPGYLVIILLSRVVTRLGSMDFINPKVTWGTDECSPAGVTITRSTAFIGALQGECLFAVRLDGEDVAKPRAYFGGDHGRIRSVTTAPDGALWVTTSNTDGRGDLRKGDDRILRVTL
jgi:glucose/arabinose dehydrogenase